MENGEEEVNAPKNNVVKLAMKGELQLELELELREEKRLQSQG